MSEPATATAPRPGYDAIRAERRGLSGLRVAVLIPCRDEAVTIGQVVSDFRRALPEARVYVYDNNSADETGEVARQAGATVRRERRQGKGYVVRRMFADIEADAYVLVDGDGTYDPTDAPAMVRMLVAQQLDMVTGVRVDTSKESYRRGHRFGNRVLTGIVRRVFGDRTSDLLSGYRVFSRRFVKSFPALSAGFETETEFTVHALELGMPLGEMRTRYQERPAGFGLQAAHIPGWDPHPAHDHQPGEGGAAADVLRLHRRGISDGRRASRPAAHRALPGDRAGATPADGAALRHPHHPLRPVDVLRADPRFRRARPEGNQADGLPLLAGDLARPMTVRLAGSAPPEGDYDADILILSLDRPTETEAAIRSALDQKDLKSHLIIFDQGSSAETLGRLAGLIGGRGDALLASAGHNPGVAEGRNRASALGHGRVLIALDNDAVFADRSTAARAVTLLDAQPRLAALGFRIMNGDGSDDDDASWGYPEALHPRAADRFPCATFVGAGHAIRRAAWDVGRRLRR